MYLPKHFEEKDIKETARLIENYPLAVVICNSDDEIVANHIPLMISTSDELIGHIAKSNQLHHQIESGSKILAIFRGEDSYISPNWYPTKPQTHRHVPTWNYQVVHVYGRITFLHSKKEKIATVGKLTKFHEKKLFGDKEWKMADAPKGYMESMIENIVAFKIDVEKITTKFKLSQNREIVDFKNVARVMKEIGKSDLSKGMEKLNREAK